MAIACIETLENRRQFAATVGLDPVFGKVNTAFSSNYETTPTCAVALPGGRVLVAGVSQQYNGTNEIEYNVFALYSKTGGLISSFNHHHVLLQDAATTETFGEVGAMTALPDGSVLVVANSGVHRLRLDGTFDPDFGNAGVLPKHAYSAVVQPNGTIQALQETISVQVTNGYGEQVYHSRLLTFTDEGRYLSETAAIAGQVQCLSDGRLYALSDTGVGTFYDTNLQPDATFGTNGSVDLQAAAERWAIKHGPWYVGTRNVSASPTVQVNSGWNDAPIPLVGGGYAVPFTVDAGHAPNEPWPYFEGRYVRLDANGGIVTTGVTANTFQPAGVISFTSTYNSGTFTFGDGSAVSVAFPFRDSTPVTARAPDGSYFIADASDTVDGFEIIHTLPVAGSISGTLFGDTNNNGQQDPNEAPAVDKVVYLDTNNNGRLDLGEAWTTTDADGHYTFDDLGPGTYVVRRVLPKGYETPRPAEPQTLAVGQVLTVSIGSIAM